MLALDAASASRDHGAAWYFISSKWLKLWGNFVKGGDLPGAITNDFVDKTGKGLRNMRKGNRDTLGMMLPLIQRRLGFHYRVITEDTWRYLHTQHGGGPEVRRHGIVLDDDNQSDSGFVTVPSSPLNPDEVD